MPNDSSQDIRDRSFAFSCAVVRLVNDVRPPAGTWAVVNQLVRAATSVGANLEEAKGASSRREFVRYIEIGLRSARETRYWLRICREAKIASAGTLDPLLGEADQLARILAAIAISAKRRMPGNLAVFAFCILNFALRVS